MEERGEFPFGDFVHYSLELSKNCKPNHVSRGIIILRGCMIQKHFGGQKLLTLLNKKEALCGKKSQISVC